MAHPTHLPEPGPQRSASQVLLNKYPIPWASLHLLLVPEAEAVFWLLGRTSYPSLTRQGSPDSSLPQGPSTHNTGDQDTSLLLLEKGWVTSFLDVEGDTVPKSRETRICIASDRGKPGGKPEPAEDRAGSVMRIFSLCSLPEPLAVAAMRAPFTPVPSQLPHPTKMQLGNFRVGVGEEK